LDVEGIFYADYWRRIYIALMAGMPACFGILRMKAGCFWSGQFFITIPFIGQSHRNLRNSRIEGHPYYALIFVYFR